MSTRTYPLIRSTLQGIFSTQVAFSDEAANAALIADLAHASFREGMRDEIVMALTDKELSFQALLDECGVAFFDTEHEARAFFERVVAEPVRSGSV